MLISRNRSIISQWMRWRGMEMGGEEEFEWELLLGSKYSSSSSEVVFLTLLGPDATTVP